MWLCNGSLGGLNVRRGQRNWNFLNCIDSRINVRDGRVVSVVGGQLTQLKGKNMANESQVRSVTSQPADAPDQVAPAHGGDGVPPSPVSVKPPRGAALPDVELKPVDYKQIKERLEKSVKEHAAVWDGWVFNGGIILTLCLTAAAAMCSAYSRSLAGAVLSAVAGVFVAIERSLSFGARWRFHEELRNGYRSIIDMIDFATLMPEGPEKQKYNKDIWTALYALRSRESAIPGSGSAPI